VVANKGAGVVHSELVVVLPSHVRVYAFGWKADEKMQAFISCTKSSDTVIRFALLALRRGSCRASLPALFFANRVSVVYFRPKVI